MRSLLIAFMLAAASIAGAAPASSQSNPPPTDSGDGRDCDREKKKQTTS